MVLKGISPLISPDLLRALALIGHGDEIVLADAFFPGASISSKHNIIYVRADGIGVPALLEAILDLIDLDTYVDSPASLMDTAEQDKAKGITCPIWNEYERVLKEKTNKNVKMSFLERFAFYEKAKKSFIIVQTGETAIYGNIILTNGVVQQVASGKK